MSRVIWKLAWGRLIRRRRQGQPIMQDVVLRVTVLRKFLNHVESFNVGVTVELLESVDAFCAAGFYHSNSNTTPRALQLSDLVELSDCLLPSSD